MVYFSLKEFNLGIVDMLRVLFSPAGEEATAQPATAEPRKPEGKNARAKLDGRGKKKKSRRER